MDLMVAIVICAAIFVVCVAADVWLGRHPFKKVDKRTDKYEWRGW